MVDVYRAHQQCANRDRLAFAGPGFPSSLERMTTVMAITCPHALGLAVPLVGTVSTSLAAGIVFAAEEHDVSPVAVAEFENLLHKSASARDQGSLVRVMSPSYLRNEGIEIENQYPAELTAQDKIVVFMLEGGRIIALAEVVREECCEAMGIQCIMLTGGDDAVAKARAAELGLDD